MFKLDTLSTETIREAARYSGIRVSMIALIATARVSFRLDVNFGDPVTPGPQDVHLPALLSYHQSISVLGYPLETVLAEKLATAIELGPANTRVRDYADVYALTGQHSLALEGMRRALRATSIFRGVELVPLSEVVSDIGGLRASAYSAYIRSLRSEGAAYPASFADVVAAVCGFADPLIARTNESQSVWEPTSRTWVLMGSEDNR